VINDRAEKTEITTGMNVRDYREVLSGINPGDVVVTLGHENVSDGNFLKVTRDDVQPEAPAEKKECGCRPVSGQGCRKKGR
jgi:hypothetical protein